MIGAETIGESCFQKNTLLETVTLRNTVRKVRDFAFANCLALKSVDLGRGVTEIHDQAFADCYKLDNVTIPASVEKIGSLVFYNCQKLIVSINGDPQIKEDSFTLSQLGGRKKLSRMYLILEVITHPITIAVALFCLSLLIVLLILRRKYGDDYFAERKKKKD